MKNFPNKTRPESLSADCEAFFPKILGKIDDFYDLVYRRVSDFALA